MDERYLRHIQLDEVGETGQRKISGSSVLVVGAGGLGCPALSYMAAAGVGTIGICDGDVVELSNLQRQTLYREKDIGTNKAHTSAMNLKALNPGVKFHVHDHYLDSNNAADLIGSYDVVLDGSDRLDIRYLLSDTCAILKKPLVYGAIYKFEGQVSVFCYQDGPDYRDLYPSVSESDVLSCNESGVLGVLPGLIGTIQAAEVLKIILEMEGVLKGKLLLTDIRSYKTRLLQFEAKQQSSRPSSLEQIYNTDYRLTCGTESVKEVLPESLHLLLESENALLLDIREAHERPVLRQRHIRVRDSNGYTPEIGKDHYVICQKGIRSRSFVSELSQRGFQNVYSVKGGVEEWLKSEIEI